MKPGLLVCALSCALVCGTGGAFAASGKGHKAAVPASPTQVPVTPRPPLLPVLPQNDVLPASLEGLSQNREDIASALVVVELGQGEDNPRWQIGQTQLQVLLSKLFETVRRQPGVEDHIWPQLPRPDGHYRGIRLLFQTSDGRRFAPLLVFEGKVTAPNMATVTRDYGRQLEYFMFGTARVRRDQMLGVHYLPVFTFEQCRLMGQKILDTEPRQCLLPDNNILLETDEKPTLKAARMKTFDECLLDGKALIYTFPRRCLTAGGRVLTEPPQVYEAARQAEAKKAEEKARKAALVQVLPQNTAVGKAPLGQEVSHTVTPSPSTVVAMPTPRTVSPVILQPGGVLPVGRVSPTAPHVSPTVVPVKEALAAARSVLGPVASPSPSHPVSPVFAPMTLGR